MTADMILLAKNILTMDAACTCIEAVACKDGRIAAVGLAKDILTFKGPDTKVIEVPDFVTVTPGMRDSHMHLLSFGYTLDQVNCRNAKNIPELIERCKAFAVENDTPAGAWIAGRGWDQNLMDEQRFPVAVDLDEAFPDNPVFLVRSCGHIASVNSCALKVMGITKDTPDPDGGVIGRDDSGEADGIFYEEGAVVIPRGYIFNGDPKILSRCLQKAAKIALKAGLVEVHTDDMGYAAGLQELVDIYEELEEKGEMPLHIELELLVNTYAECEAMLDMVKNCTTKGKNIRLSNIKLLLDGSLGARTAAMTDDYSDAPGQRGMLNWPVNEFKRTIKLAHDFGLPVAAHVIGDEAARIAVEGIEEAMTENPRPDPRHRLVHLQVASEETYQKIAKLGIVADIQPRFVSSDYSMIEARFGSERSKLAYMWKSLEDRNIRTAGGSDCPIEPFDPLLGMNAAITRCEVDGKPEGGWHPEECLDLTRALALFTTSVPYTCHGENERGSIKIGQKADFTLVNGDLAADCAAVTLKNSVYMTIIDGKVQWESK